MICPKVSIIIPVYNGSNYLHRAIDSALAQTYTNIEVIVVNDGSKDDGQTEQIAKSYGEKIKYFYKENGYVASALNFGITQMSGDYFSWLSHDDEYYPNKIAEQINILNSLDNKHTILFSAYDLINEQSKLITTVYPSAVLDNTQLNTNLGALCSCLIHGCSLLIHKSLFKTYGMFDETLRTTNDYMLWHNFLNNHQTKIKYIDIPLIKSRVHSNQDTHKLSDIVLAECDTLWRYIIDNTSDDKMLEIEGSRHAFYQRMHLLLEKTPYKQASLYAKQKADATIGLDLVSIIIPFFNRVSLLIEAITSALNQTYRNIEIIIVNDNSTEDLNILHNFIKNYSNILYFDNPKKGAASARNFGLSKACGAYIAFLDSDDLFEPEKIEVQLNKMIEQGCYISHTSYKRINSEGKTLDIVYSNDAPNTFPEVIRQCTIATSTVLLRKSLLDNKQFNESLKVAEDVCLWIDILYDRKIYNLENPLAKIRISAETTSTNNELVIQGLLNTLNHCINNKNYNKYHQQINFLIKYISTLYNTTYKSEIYSRVNIFKKISLLYKKCKKAFAFVYRYGIKNICNKLMYHVHRHGIKKTCNKLIYHIRYNLLR